MIVVISFISFLSDNVGDSIRLKVCPASQVHCNPITYYMWQFSKPHTFQSRRTMSHNKFRLFITSNSSSVISPFLPEASFGLRVLSLPVSVRPSVTKFVRAITHNPIKLGSPNLDQRCKIPWLRSLLFWGWLILTAQIKPNFKILFICIAFESLKYLWDMQKQSLLNCYTSHSAPHIGRLP